MIYYTRQIIGRKNTDFKDNVLRPFLIVDSFILVNL